MLRFVFKSMKRRIISILMVAVVCTVSLMLVSMSVYIYENSIYCTKAINSIMKEKVENSAVVAITNKDDNKDNENNAFRNVLIDMPEVSAAGCIELKQGMDGCGFDEVQKKLKGDNYDGLSYTYMESSAAGLYNIEMDEGELVKDMPYDDSLVYVYLGRDFKKFYSIGDESEWKVTENMSIKFVVKGFFKDGVRIPEQDELEETGAFLGDKCYYTLGKADVIMEVNKTDGSDIMLCSWKDGCSFDEMRTKIVDKAEKYGAECIVASLSEILDEKGKSTKEINEYILNVLGVILLTTLIMMVCIQVTSILNNMSEYGILYANGFTTANIALMFIIENVFRMIVTCVISLLLVKKLITILLYIVPEEEEVFRDIFYNHVIWGNIGAASFMCIVSLIIPIIFISRLKPVQLIGGNDT